MFGSKKHFILQDSVVVDVRDLAAAKKWYAEKLGLTYSSTDIPEDQGSMVLGYSAEDAYLYLVQTTGDARPNTRPGHPPIMFSKKLPAAHEHLSSRGVAVGPIQSDSGGNRFFRFPDLDGNELEVCQQT
jgi:catechol 2,3-dioxygenase-like lactoylglutathione lyase family enzyme